LSASNAVATKRHCSKSGTARGPNCNTRWRCDRAIADGGRETALVEDIGCLGPPADGRTVIARRDRAIPARKGICPGCRCAAARRCSVGAAIGAVEVARVARMGGAGKREGGSADAPQQYRFDDRVLHDISPELPMWVDIEAAGMSSSRWMMRSGI